MAFSNPELEKQLSGMLGGASVSSSPKINTTKGSYSNPQLETNIQQMIKQGPSMVQKPQKIAPTTPQKEQFSFSKATQGALNVAKQTVATVKGIDIKKIGGEITRARDLFALGSKNIPQQLKVTGGIILQQLSNLNKKIYPQAVLEKLPGGKRYSEARDRQKVSGEKISEAGAAELQKLGTERAKFGQREGLGNIADIISYSAPSTASSIGIGIIGSIVATPTVGITLGVSSSFAQTTGDIYTEARSYKMSKEKAQLVAMTGGVLIASIESLPIGRLLEKTPGGQQVKKTLIKNIIDGVLTATQQGLLEGSTEGVQQIVQNALALTYDEHRNIMEGSSDAVLAGIFLGSASDITVNALNTSIDTVMRIDEKKVNDGLKEIQKALQTPAEKRTPQQQKIAEALLSENLTPDEAIARVVSAGIENTSVGNQITLAAVEAKEQGKNLQIQLSPDQDTADINIVESNFTPLSQEMTEQANPQDIEAQTVEQGQVQPQNVENVEKTDIPQIPEELIPLAEEAKKFSNADEFAKIVLSKGLPDTKEMKMASEIRTKIEELKIKGAQAKADNNIEEFTRLDKEFTDLTEQLKGIDDRSTLNKLLGDSYDLDANIKKLTDFYNSFQKKDTIPSDRQQVEENLTEEQKKLGRAAFGSVQEDLKDKVDKKQPTKEPVTPQTTQPEKRETGDEPGTELRDDQAPVGEGKVRESEAYRKVRDRLEEATQQDVNYNRLNLAQDAENAMKFISKDPQAALRVAFGLEAPPVGQTETAISIALADKAGRDGNYKLQSQLESSRSLRQTRRGQEIVSERGRFKDDSPYQYMRELLDRRLKDIGHSVKSDIVDQFNKKVSSAKQKAVDIIDKKTDELVQRIKKRDKKKIELAQDIISKLTCKV